MRRGKYATAFVFDAPISKYGSADFASSTDWTPAAGDVKVSKDGGNVANITTLPTAIGGTGSKLWHWSLSATEMTAKVITIQVSNGTTVTDQAFDVFTYGNASASIIDSNGIEKNTARSNFAFIMADVTTGLPMSGLTVAATRRIDAGSFAACTNSVTEIANGWYTIDLSASDLNGDVIALRFTATGAADAATTILTRQA